MIDPGRATSTTGAKFTFTPTSRRLPPVGRPSWRASFELPSRPISAGEWSGGPSSRFTSPPSWSIVIKRGGSPCGRPSWSDLVSDRSWLRELMLRLKRITPPAPPRWIRFSSACGAAVPSNPKMIRWPAISRSDGPLVASDAGCGPIVKATSAAAAMEIPTRRMGGTLGPSDLLVLVELLAHHAACLADRGAVRQRGPDRVEQVAVALRHLAQLVQPPRHGVLVAVGLERGEPLHLVALGIRIDLEDVHVVDLVGHVLVHPAHDVLLDPVALLVTPGRLLDLGPDERDRLHRAAQLLHLLHQVQGPLLDLVRERLHEVGARERVDRVGRARLVGEDLLRSQGDARGALGGQRERLVEAVRVERLRAAADRRETLERDAHDVVLRLLGGERDPACLGVEADPLGARVLRAEALAHDARPHPAHGAELGHLLEHVVVPVEEEGQPGAELVDLQAGVDRRLDVGDRVAQRERD